MHTHICKYMYARTHRRKTQSLIVFDTHVINNIQYYYVKDGKSTLGTLCRPIERYTSASFYFVIVHVSGPHYMPMGDYIHLKECPAW